MTDSARERRLTRRAVTGLTIGLALALTAAVMPLFGVIMPGVWNASVAGFVLLLLAAGWVARMLRLHGLLATLIELVIWVAVMTAAVGADSAWVGIVPTVETLDLVGRLLEQASGEIRVGVAPLDPTPALTLLVAALTGLLAIAMDHVIITARMPLLGAIALVAVWVIPAVIVPSPVDVVSFALLTIATMVLLRVRTREQQRAREAGRTAWFVPVATGTAAIVLALVIAPSLPTPTAPVIGTGGSTSLDASLALGDDLRQPAETVLLRYRTNASALPYLRVATISTFDGEEWQPDRGPYARFDPNERIERSLSPDVRVTEYETTIEVLGLSSSWLPLPAPMVAVDGLEGEWTQMADNGTLTADNGTSQGQTYTVTTQVARPTLEQIRASEAVSPNSEIDLLQLPDDVPFSVREQAEIIMGSAENDFDRLMALEEWFRGPEFEYSLTAPVQRGFDGTSAEALDAFLQVRAGYCIHFASAFAAMARSYDIPTRIVVGVLPGGYTGDSEDGQRVAEATSNQLHAWPEVYFTGIGWISFEPTKSLGSATTFLPETAEIPDDDGVDVAGPTPSAPPVNTPSPPPTANQDAPDVSTPTSGGVELADLRPYLLAIGLVVLVAGAPAVARLLIERRLRARARDGSAPAAWQIVRNTVRDLGGDVSAAQSVRALGTALVADRGAPEAQITRLVDGVERASYAPDPGMQDGEGLVADAIAVREALLDAASADARILARFLPRSLLSDRGGVGTSGVGSA